MPEENVNSIRYPVPKEEGKHTGHKIRTITISDTEGIKGLYCLDDKKVITYIFAKNKGWDMEKVKTWVGEHTKRIKGYKEVHVDQEPNFISLGIEYLDGEVKYFTPREEVFTLPDDSDSGIVISNLKSLDEAEDYLLKNYVVIDKVDESTGVFSSADLGCARYVEQGKKMIIYPIAVIGDKACAKPRRTKAEGWTPNDMSEQEKEAVSTLSPEGKTRYNELRTGGMGHEDAIHECETGATTEEEKIRVIKSAKAQDIYNALSDAEKQEYNALETSDKYRYMGSRIDGKSHVDSLPKAPAKPQEEEPKITPQEIIDGLSEAERKEYDALSDKAKEEYISVRSDGMSHSEAIKTKEKGGQGSGNFGHLGIDGQRGGSMPTFQESDLKETERGAYMSLSEASRRDYASHRNAGMEHSFAVRFAEPDKALALKGIEKSTSQAIRDSMTDIEQEEYYALDGAKRRLYMLARLDGASHSEAMTQKEKGGAGSGNFGHEGVEGQRGGSAPGQGGSGGKEMVEISRDNMSVGTSAGEVKVKVSNVKNAKVSFHSSGRMTNEEIATNSEYNYETSKGKEMVLSVHRGVNSTVFVTAQAGEGKALSGVRITDPPIIDHKGVDVSFSMSRIGSETSSGIEKSIGDLADNGHIVTDVYRGIDSTVYVTEKEVTKSVKDSIESHDEDMEIVKVDKDKRITYGVFLYPERADHDGDVISSEDIEKVAHSFLIEYRKIDEMHKEIIKAEIVESAIAWVDGLDYYGKKLNKGAWFGAIKINDDAVWDKVKDGTYKGFSVRISGTREPIEGGK